MGEVVPVGALPWYRRAAGIVVCILLISATVPYPVSAEGDTEFAQLQRELRAFNERTELSYYRLLLAYENLSRALEELEAAYSEGNESRVRSAEAEYMAAAREFQSAVAQAYELRREGEVLANRTLDFIRRAVEAGMLPPELSVRAEENYALLMQRTSEAFALLRDVNESAGRMDAAELKRRMLHLSAFVNSTLDAYAATHTPQFGRDQSTAIVVMPVGALNLRGKMFVEPEVEGVLEELEDALESAKQRLGDVEAAYPEPVRLRSQTDNLSRIREKLSALREATRRGVSRGDVEELAVAERELRTLLGELNATLSSTGAAASEVFENLTEAKAELEVLHGQVHRISYINASRSLRFQRIERELASMLDRIDGDFRYLGYAWRLMGEEEGMAGELMGIEGELRGVEENLRMGGRRSYFGESIAATAALAEETSRLRERLLVERRRVEGVAEELRQFGMEWARVYREVTEPAQTYEPSPEYLNETVDARITPEIEALAESLEYDPARIYAFVRENVSYEAYWGSARGSVWTLSSGAGNAFDQASLLVSLLRASGIPARYVQGWVEVTKEQLVELLEGRNVTVNGTSYAMSFEDAVEVVDAVGIPYRVTQEGVELEHVWVEALLPEKHRCRCMSWSFESLSFGELSTDMEEERRGRISRGEVVAEYVWKPLDPVLRDYTVISAINYAEIPEDYRHRVQIRTSDGIDSGVIPLPLLAKERVILRYVPASEGDASLLGDESLYRLLDAGGREWYVGYYMWGYWVSGPTYAYVVPELVIGNESVAKGNVTRLGSWQTLILNFSYADRWMQNTKGYMAGDMLSITLSPAHEPPERITEEAGKVTSLYQRYNATRNASAYDDFVAQMLYTTGIAYYAASDKTTELGEEVFFTKSYNPVTRGDYVHRGAEYWEVWRGYWGFYDVYAYYMPGGPAHDHRVDITESYSTIGQREGMVAFNLLVEGFAGSGWESQSIYALYNTTAVSTTYILAYAQNMSMPIYTINSTNYNEEIPKLRQPEWIKDRVRALAQAGYIVVIPEAWVTINQWQGTGWAAIDPYTGLGAYIIAGGMYYANTTAPPQILSGGWGTVPVNMSESLGEFQYYAMNLSNELQNVTDKIQANERLIELLVELIAHGSPIAITTWAGITLILGGITGEIGGIGLTTPAAIVAIGLGIFLLIPNIILFLSIAQEVKKILTDPAGEIIILGGIINEK